MQTRWFVICLASILSVTAIVITIILTNNASNAPTNAQSVNAPTNAQSVVTSQNDNMQPVPDPVHEDERVSEYNKELAHTAHLDILSQILNSPDDFFDYDYSIPLNDCHYAMLDIDSDGVDELAVDFTACPTASMYMSVWKYDPVTNRDTEYAILNEGSIFYRGNYVKAPHSHNHSGGYTVWPYDILKYDRSTCEYICVAYGYSNDIDYLFDSFPSELDVDGDGVLYYLETAEGYEALTEQEYLKCVNRYIPDENLIDAQWLELTYDNVFPSAGTLGSAVSSNITSPELFCAGMVGRVAADTPAHAGVNMRVSPQSDSELILTLGEGEAVEIINDYDGQNHGYILVSYTDPDSGVNVTGWVLVKYLECS